MYFDNEYFVNVNLVQGMHLWNVCLVVSNPQVHVTYMYFSIIHRSHLLYGGRTAAAKVKNGDFYGGFQGLRLAVEF